MRRNLTGLAVVLAVLAAGVAYAAASSPTKQNSRQAFFSDVAQRLGVSTSKLQAAFKGAFDDRIAAAVAAGRLTSAQANAIEQRVGRAGRFAFGTGVGPMAAAIAGAVPGKPGPWGPAACHTKVSAGTGTSTGTSTTTTTPSGSTTVVTCASGHWRMAPPGQWGTAVCRTKVSAGSGTSTTTTTTPGSGTSTTSASSTTSNQVTSATTIATAGGSTTIITHGGAGKIVIHHGMFGFGRWGHAPFACGGPALHTAIGFGLLGGLRTASGYLGLTTAKLISELRAGKSLSQIASAQGKTLAGLRSAVEQQLREQLDKLVAAGRLTKAQEQRILTARAALDQTALNGKGSWSFAPALRRAWRGNGRTTPVPAPWLPGGTVGP